MERGAGCSFSLGTRPTVDMENRAKRPQPNVNSPISVLFKSILVRFLFQWDLQNAK